MAFTNKGPEYRAKKEAAVGVALATGLGSGDLAAIQQAREVQEAEARVAADAPKEGKRLFILQEVKVDQFNTLRRRIELTPSMCRARNCGFDASKEVGYASGWNTIPHDQLLPTGKTLGEAVLSMLELHASTAHAIEQSHIMTEDEVNRGKNWSGVPGAFLTPARA